MILQLLLATIAAATPVPAAPVAQTILVPRGRLVCRAEFGTSSLVQRIRICHAAADWRRLDARERERRRRGP